MNIKSTLACLSLLTLLTACGSGSGAATQENPNTAPPSTSNYTGPAPATADIQTFKLEVWDNLVTNDRCGSCHNESQSPRFVRADDVNMAYNEANIIADLLDPGSSQMVLKVRGGHNCWEANDDVCGDIIQAYITNWAGATLGGGPQEIQLTAPVIKDPGASKNFPADSALFASNVYPLLTTYCAGCHTDSAAVPQSPYFASSEIDTAYQAAQARMDLDNPANSRFALRLGSEFHNCWTDCTANSTEMANAIAAMSDGIALTELDPALVTSKALNLTDGIVASSGGRFEANVIAKYEFKTGSGNIAYDTSGVEPALNLTLSGGYDWVGGWGVALTAGKAQGSTADSAKLHDLITSTNEFTVEAWVAAANVTQDGPARIVSYSGGSDARNFMLGQTLYQYDFLNRTDETGEDGEPRLSTNDADEDLQATLQHVVVTYDPAGGRIVYVNGTFTDDLDSVAPGLLNDWNDTYALVVGSEVDNNNRWAGTVRFMAIHNRVLTPEQVLQNFDAGVGEKYYLLFSVSDHVGVADAYVAVVVSQFDSYGYLFDEPFFVVLGSDPQPGTFDIEGIRIGLNGRELSVSQAYQNIDIDISDAAYAVEGLQRLSDLGTLVPLEKGPAQDEFFLTFEAIGSESNTYSEVAPTPPPPAPDLPRDPTIGVRDFAEVNATMAKLMDIDSSTPAVRNTYELVRQAMPVQPAIGGFISSQQMGITQLAISYCSALVDDPTERSSFFPGFDFSAPAASAFGNRSLITDPLMDRLVGTSIATQGDVATLEAEVNDLIDRLTACGGSCEADRTERVVKGACASVLGSATMLVQ